MKSVSLGIVAVIAVVLAILVYASAFIVNPRQQALVLQFGEVRRAITEPGLYLKIPVIQNVVFLDKRILDLDVPPQELIVADQKRLVVDAFARYRIANPVLFYQTVNNVYEGSSRLATFLQSSMRAILAEATSQQVVRDDRTQLMQRIRDEVQRRAQGIGVDVVDVRIRRADLPEANSQAIFRRMQTERLREATEIRAQGSEDAQRITAQADRERQGILSEANREAEQIRGLGDGERSSIFAEAYTLAPDFFSFYRSMQAYEVALKGGNTKLVISPDSSFFSFFNSPAGPAPAAVAAPAK
ncbi:protease modulator HflC [Segnochrobactraceae bacterium EtOH-i3]